MADDDKVYNVEHVDFIIASGMDDDEVTEFEDPIDGEKLNPVTGISDDGFGITPEAETE